jgi:hypothetical protein
MRIYRVFILIINKSMSVLNYNNYPFIWTWARPEDVPPPAEPPCRIEWKQYVRPSAMWLAELDNRPGDYFYIEIMHCDAFYIYPLDTLVPPDILDKIKTGEVTLVIANSGHGYHEIVDGIYKHVIIKYGINPKHIILRSESYDMTNEIDIVVYNYNLPKVNYEWTLEFEFQQSIYVNDLDWFKTNTLEYKNYDKKFLSFNGMYRHHRGTIIMLLACMGVLDKGLVSYNIKPGGMDSRGVAVWDWTYNSLRYNAEFEKMFMKNREMLYNINKFELDIIPDGLSESGEINIATVYPAHVQPNHVKYYEDTYFSVVTETSFPILHFHQYWPHNTDIGRILSEKIFKPISMKHPFIVVSNPGVLDLLKNLGYKTFHPLIDETYDKVQDPAIRLMMIAKETKKLCELEGEALANFLTKAKEICEYNFKVLKNKKKFVYKLV